MTNAVRLSLAGLLALCALNALAGGAYGITGARGVPVEWLTGSPFHSYCLPSLMLFGAVGGSSAFASFWVFTRRPNARPLAAGAGLILLIWIAAQVLIIGYVSWLQPTMAALAAVIMGLAALRPNPPNPLRG